MNVFVSGSRSITKLDNNIINALFDELNSNVKILVGDADGVDTEVQKFCSAQQYRNVVVFISNGKARNNIGEFTVQSIKVNTQSYNREYFTQKDIAMTDIADYGIAIWDGKSKGSLNNIKRLIMQNKPCFVYLDTDKKWITIEDEKTLNSYILPHTNKQQEFNQLSFI